MSNLSTRELRRSDEGRRGYIWANVAAFGVLAFVIALILMGPGGAPQPETGQAGVTHTQPGGRG